MSDGTDLGILVASILASALAVFVVGPWFAAASTWAVIGACVAGFCATIGVIMWDAWQ